MNPSTNANQTIGFAGIAPHERNTILYVQRIYPDHLKHVREVADPQSADVIFADPLTAEGQQALKRTDAFVIALQDRRSPAIESARLTLFRPLRPRAVLDTLNNVEKVSLSTPQPKLVSESAALSDIFRMALRRGSNAQGVAISDQGKTWLLIDPSRDRIRGNLDLLNVERLAVNARHVFSRIPQHQASGLLQSENEQPLYRTLWQLARDVGERSVLFGDETASHFRFECWPNFADAGISGKLLRAVSLMRHGSFTVSDACERTGLDRDQMLVLLNGSWLTGELCLTDEAVVARQTAAPNATRVNASVLARIRSRLSRA